MTSSKIDLQKKIIIIDNVPKYLVYVVQCYIVMLKNIMIMIMMQILVKGYCLSNFCCCFHSGFTSNVDM